MHDPLWERLGLNPDDAQADPVQGAAALLSTLWQTTSWECGARLSVHHDNLCHHWVYEYGTHCECCREQHGELEELVREAAARAAAAEQDAREGLTAEQAAARAAAAAEQNSAREAARQAMEWPVVRIRAPVVWLLRVPPERTP